jgi:hypothetical protein
MRDLQADSVPVTTKALIPHQANHKLHGRAPPCGNGPLASAMSKFLISPMRQTLENRPQTSPYRRERLPASIEAKAPTQIETAIEAEAQAGSCKSLRHGFELSSHNLASLSNSTSFKSSKFLSRSSAARMPMIRLQDKRSSPHQRDGQTRNRRCYSRSPTWLGCARRDIGIRHVGVSP